MNGLRKPLVTRLIVLPNEAKRYGNMPATNESVSEEETATLTAHSVFDFLYNDSRRIASFLSQFEGGHLTQLVKSNEASKSTSEQASRDFSLGVTKVLGGASRSSESEGESAKEGLVRTFDPYWTNARAFLDYLSDRGLIERQLDQASIGQFVLVTGTLAIVDMSAMQSVWKIPVFNEMLAASIDPPNSQPQVSRNQRRTQQGPVNKDPLAKFPVELRLAIELLPTMPHSVIASMIGEVWATWSTLSSEHLVGTAADLILKHGIKLGGEWSMLGVLDALPDFSDGSLDPVETFILGAGENSIITNATLGLAPAIRTLAGRPGASYGLTPLLIFRQIGTPTSQE